MMGSVGRGGTALDAVWIPEKSTLCSIKAFNDFLLVKIVYGIQGPNSCFLS